MNSLSKLTNLNLSSKLDKITSSQPFKNLSSQAEKLAVGTAENVISGVGCLVGVDLKNPEIGKKLDEINSSLTNKDNLDKMREVVANAAEAGEIAVEAAEPLIDPLTKLVSDTAEKIGTNFSEAAVKVALNTVEEIPGYGIIAGTIRSALNTGDAIAGSVEAASEALEATNELGKTFSRKIKQIVRDKENVLDRTSDTIQKYEKSAIPADIKVNPADIKVNPANIKVNPANIKVNPTNIKVNPANIKDKSVKLGGTKRYKKNKCKTKKKVRFNL